MELPAVIEGLLKPTAYPEKTSAVELRQTHCSYIFLTEKHAYKVKKPVNFGFLDFTTLEKRYFFCSEEVRLNRRLAREAYLDVVPVTCDEGIIRMEGSGEAVEYAVKMKRLPEDSILENRLREDEGLESLMPRIGRVIASFHGNAATDKDISRFGSMEVIGRNTEENFAQTTPFIGLTISGERHERLEKYTRDFIEKNKSLLEKRVAGGFIRDCHGDLHSEHISLTDGIIIFDCIEFNERFRFSDVVSDLAFLSMDLDFHNRADLSRLLEESYFSITGDGEGRSLLDFYKCYRAFVRGKVEGFKYMEHEVSEDEKRDSLIKAHYHFHLSELYASGGYRPVMVLVSGLSGTGKTALANALSKETAFVHLSSDMVRKDLAGLPHGERRSYAFREGIYTNEFTERTYAVLMERASEALEKGRSVIVDATFIKRGHYEMAKAAAVSHGALFRPLKTVAGDDTVRDRLLQRECETPKAGSSDAGWEVYLRQKTLWEEREAGAVIHAEAPLDERLLKAAVEIFG